MASSSSPAIYTYRLELSHTYRSLILRQTEPPFSSSLPFLPPQQTQTNNPDKPKDGGDASYTSTASIDRRQQEPQIPSYTCANCSSPLFPSASKFVSGTGWPSFSSAIPGAIKTKTDWRAKEGGKWVLGGSLGVKFREEVVCKNCGGHLGHVFRGEKWDGVEEEEDGKGVTRYCVNGSSLQVEPSTPPTRSGDDAHDEPEGGNEK
ncbi:Thioredoxin [Dactylellina cionopaga]|nr:Thioredoxin [Dactylellina cionopaga]